MSDKFPIWVDSEVGKLDGVILHDPGPEVANMTPESAQRALYSDILNVNVAAEEYAQLRGVLEKRTRVFQVKELLTGILAVEGVAEGVVQRVCEAEGVPDVAGPLLELEPDRLATFLIEGVKVVKDNLTRYLSKDRYSLPPLHNFFFIRDAAVIILDQVLVTRMANCVRGRETLLMEAIFNFHPLFNVETVNPARLRPDEPEITIEGGDVLVARKDILIVGIGERTSAKAVDFLIERCKEQGLNQHILVQKLPLSPESFIHLDMVFTFLDQGRCLVFEPVIMQTHHFDTVHIQIQGQEKVKVTEEDNLIAALAKLGMDLEPVFCGGRSDTWIQEREQWHSGANFFAMAPGQVIGYGRNEYTLAQLADSGFAVVPAAEIISGKTDLDSAGPCVVTIDGSELARGGGGCRCMTMPLRRQKLI